MNLDLELQTDRTKDGLYAVTYAYFKAPLNMQEAAFDAAGLHMVSPAELGYLRHTISGDNPFFKYSRTNTDVFIDLRDKANPRVVLLPGEVLSNQFLSDLVEAHQRYEEFVVPKNRINLAYDIVDNYDIVDKMVDNGTAIVTTHGTHSVPSSQLGQNNLTNPLFSDSQLGIRAEDYGTLLIGRGITAQNIIFDSADYALSQKGSYLNRLRVCGPDGGFGAFGSSRYLVINDGAFGVRFEKIAEGDAKK